MRSLGQLCTLSPLLLALATLGCGGGTDVAATRDPSAAAAPALATAPTTYGGAPEPPLASDPPTLAARAIFEAAIPPELRGHIKSDGWLDFAARAAAAIEFENAGKPSRSTLRWVLWRAGVTATYDTAYADTWRITGSRRGAYTMETQHAGHLDEDIVRFLHKLVPRPEDRIYGIARYDSGGTATTQAILVAALPIEVEPFAKSWTPSADVTITIRDLRGHVAPMLYADLGAEVKTLVMEPRGAGASVTFKAPATPGRMMIEVRAERRVGGARAQVTVLQVPLWVGVPEASTARELLGPPAPPQPTPEAMGAAIRAAYDAVRSRAGRQPFATDPRLNALAAGWAQRASQGAPAPVTTEELRQAGLDVRFSVHQESLKASDYGDYAAIQLTSPYTKSMLLEREASLVVAVVPSAGEGRVAIVEALIWPKAAAGAPPTTPPP
jgi:hypothetical protein